MRTISAMIAVLLLAGACAGSGASDMARTDDPGRVIFDNGMVTGGHILVPGTSTTVPY
jgi:hypothetical protein